MTLEGLNEDFRDLLVLFAEAGVDFVIVGAYALAFHGAPRASGDIDLFVRPDPDNAGRVFGGSPASPSTRRGGRASRPRWKGERWPSSAAPPCSRTRMPRVAPRTWPT
jgi:hypothetical protein